MRKVSVCTRKSSRLGSVYKLTMLTAQRSQGSNLRFQPILWSKTITRYYTIMQNRNKNYCSLDLTSLFHHTLGFMLLAYTGKCPQAVPDKPCKRTTDKTSYAVTTQFSLKLWLLRRDIIKIETGICVAFLLQVRNIIFVSLMFTSYIYIIIISW